MLNLNGLKHFEFFVVEVDSLMILSISKSVNWIEILVWLDKTE